VGVNQPPRRLTASEVRYRDFEPAIEKAQSLGTYSLGNLPVMFGEFGTFFSFNGIYQARQEEYLTSTCMLDNYYEAFERMNLGQMVWCYASENTWAKGDLWNHEDFSILDQEGHWRGEYAWARPHARSLAGKPIEAHFYSDFHYFDPDKGVQPPLHEFLVRYQSKESSAPSEIIVPELQYPDGFYVWVSDGHCFFDSKTRTLLHYPTNDAPGAEHSVRLLPPLPGNPNVGWKYFFKGERAIEKD
jgi:hypothetical protein